MSSNFVLHETSEKFFQCERFFTTAIFESTVTGGIDGTVSFERFGFLGIGNF
jgi:hypothetical protein